MFLLNILPYTGNTVLSIPFFLLAGQTVMGIKGRWKMDLHVTGGRMSGLMNLWRDFSEEVH